MHRWFAVGLLLAGAMSCDRRESPGHAADAGPAPTGADRGDDVWSSPTFKMRSRYRYYPSFDAAASTLETGSVDAIVTEGPPFGRVVVVDVQVEPAAAGPRRFVTFSGERRTTWSVANGSTSGSFRAILPAYDTGGTPHTEPDLSSASGAPTAVP